MLLQNISRFAEMPYRQGSYTIIDAVSCWAHRTETHLNKYTSGDLEAWCSVPSGYVHPYSWGMALKPGGMALFRGINGESSVSDANLAGGKNAEAEISGSGQITDVALGLIASLVAELAGSGVIFDASMIGKLEAVASLAGSGQVSSAGLGALAGLIAQLGGSGGIDSGILAALGEMAATVYVNAGSADITALANGVLDALAADHNLPGTVGQKLNAAGSAGDPWVTELPGSYSGDQAGMVMALLLKILRNKTVTDPDTGVMTVYDDDGVTPLFTADLFEDASGTQTYRGQGAERRDRLE